jgi:hypothetical protein
MGVFMADRKNVLGHVYVFLSVVSIRPPQPSHSVSHMSTYFDTVSPTFVDVKVLENDGIETEKFLLATENLIGMFGNNKTMVYSGLDKIHSTAFSPVKSDMQGNVNVTVGSIDCG